MAIGVTSSTIEIWENILAIMLFLLISGGIIAVMDADSIKSKTLNNEISYISTLKSNKNYEINLKIKNPETTEIQTTQNQITLKINDKQSQTEFYGTNIEIKKENNEIIIS